MRLQSNRARVHWLTLMLLSIFAVACGRTPIDDGDEDAGPTSDAGPATDSGPAVDSGPSGDGGTDAGPQDAGPQDAGQDAGVDGGPPPPCNVPTSSYGTIQSAVNDTNCDVVNVTSTPFMEATVTINRTVRIQGQGAGSTNISPSSGATLFNITGGTTTLADMTVSGTTSAYAVVFGTGGNLVVTDAIFNNNTGGGAIKGSGGGTLDIDDTNFTNNRTDSGTVTAPTEGGAGLNLDNVTATLGALGPVLFDGNLHVESASGNGGGAIYAGNATSFTGTDVTFTNNEARMGSGPGQATGGAVRFLGGGFECTDCIFTDNSAQTNNSTATTMGGAAWFKDAMVTLTGNRFDGNQVEAFASGSTLGYGGALFITGNSTARIVGSTISNNTTNPIANAPNNQRGGGIAIHCDGMGQTSSLTIVNSTLSGNAVNGTGRGGGINAQTFAACTVTVEVYSSTLVGNNGGDRGGAIRVQNTTGGMGSAELYNSLLIGNMASGSGPDVECNSEAGAAISGDYNAVASTSGCTMYTATNGVDPAPSGDCTLLDLTLMNNRPGMTSLETHAITAGGSCLINAGPATCSDGAMGTLSTDQTGQARSGNCDIGAYEF